MSVLLGTQNFHFSLIPGPWKAGVVLPFYEAVADLEEAGLPPSLLDLEAIL